MTTEIRLWKVGDVGSLKPIPPTKLNQEKRLEDWLEADISILDQHLIIIGRQVPTTYGGYIDLLCLDRMGDTVVVELKRDKTPRDITAQALDYASWVKDLSHEGITRIAKEYFQKRDSFLELQEAFVKKFNAELPETLNGNHSIMIVGSQIDGASERIIQYLSDSYGVNINAATFQFFQDDLGQEYLARVFLIEPSQVEIRNLTSGSSKRGRHLTQEEFQQIANDNGVGDIFYQIVQGLEKMLTKQPRKEMLTFDGSVNGDKRAVINFVPKDSNENQGLKFQLYKSRFVRCFGLDPAVLQSILPKPLDPWKYTKNADEEWSGYQGFFRSVEDVGHFLQDLEALLTRELDIIDDRGYRPEDIAQ